MRPGKWAHGIGLQVSSRRRSLLTSGSHVSSGHLTGIEKRFDISLIGAPALKEKQIQQNYRPMLAVHKWSPRRPDAESMI